MQWNIHVDTSQNNLDTHFIISSTEEKVIYLPWLDKEEQKSLLINKERRVMKSIHYNRLTDNLKKRATHQLLQTEISALNSQLSYHPGR